MQFIIKTFGALDYLELHIGLVPGGSSRLVGHFTLHPEEQTALIGALRRGLGPFHQFSLVEKTPPTARPSEITGVWIDEQAQVDAVFAEAIHQGASPEPITAAEPPSTEHRTRRTCCDTFVGDPHRMACHFYHEEPNHGAIAGRDGSAQTVAIKNAQQGAAVRAGGLPTPSPVSQKGEARFVPVKAPYDDPLAQGFDWNVVDRTTGLARMPGYVMTKESATRAADRANGNPAEYEGRYQWSVA